MKAYGYLTLVALLVAFSAAAYAFPMGGSWHVRASTPSGSVNASGSAAMAIVDPAADSVVPLRFHYMHLRNARVEGNHVVVELNSGEELNVPVPSVAVRHMVRHMAMHMSVADENTLSRILEQRMQLTECSVTDTNSLSIRYVPCYKAPVKVRARLLGILPVTVQEDIVETADGNVSVHGPWWAFLLFGKVQLAS